MGCDFSKNEVAHRGAYPRSAFDPSVFQKPQHPRGAKRSLTSGPGPINPLTGAAMRQALDRSVASVPGLLATSSCTERAAAAAAVGAPGEPGLVNSGISATESGALGGAMRSDHTAAEVAAVGSASFMTLGPRGGGRNALDVLSQRRGTAASMAGSRIRGGDAGSEYNNDVTSRFGASDADAISWGGHDAPSPHGPDLDATAMTARSMGRASFRSMGASGIRGGGIRFVPSRLGDDDEDGDLTPSPPSSDGLPTVPVVRTWQPLQPEALGDVAAAAPAMDAHDGVVVAAPAVVAAPPVPEVALRAARAAPPDGCSSDVSPQQHHSGAAPAVAAAAPLRAAETVQLGDGRGNIQDWVAEVANAGHLDVYPPLEDVQW